jgi:uncharacterized protein
MAKVWASAAALELVGRHEPEDVAKAALDAYEQNSANSIIGIGNKILRLAEVAVPASINAALVAKSRGPPEDGARG